MRERRKALIDKIQLEYHQRQFTLAAADLLVNPDPVRVHGTSDNQGVDFWIKLLEVIVVRSNGRAKEVYVKNPIRPVQGGKPHNPVMINDNGTNFDKALRLIQGRSTHLLRVSKSMAVNLHYYDLESERKLILNLKKIPAKIDKFREVKTDRFFDLDLFHKRKHEIEVAYRYKNGFDVT